VVPLPVEDEWLVSWVGRLRLSLGLTWQDVWRALGLARHTGRSVMPPAGWWLTLSDGKIRSVAAASGLATRSVERMLLSRYAGTALQTGTGLHDLLRVEPVRAAAGLGLVRSRDAACLPCLAEDGAWRTSWCLPWTVACVRHEVYLTRSCPSCGRRLLFPTVSLTQTRRDFCVFPHGSVVAVPARDAVLLRVQRLVDRYAHAEGDPARAVAAEWFVWLGEAVRAVKIRGALDGLRSADEPVRDRFAEWCANRSAAVRARTRATATRRTPTGSRRTCR
jgi:hypothetical protein